MSAMAGLMTFSTIPNLKETFIKAHLSGKDILKAVKPIIPETMGLPTAIIYLITLFLFMPFPFIDWFQDSSATERALDTFPYNKLGEVLSAILAIQSMVLLGFCDDVLDVRWRYKVWFPALAGVPLLMFYYTNQGGTTIMMPIQLEAYLGKNVDLGILYYIYMVMVIIFCTHSINILAGVNGVEAGQTLIIALSVAINDLLYVFNNHSRDSLEVHLFSLYFMLPFIGVTSALLWYNWFPAQVFVGDTFCYFAGMTLAVIGIMGHFSKTLMLFFIPQIFNFVYSCPQLFRFVECPRHRMPRLSDSGLLVCSTVRPNDKKSLGFLGNTILKVFKVFGLLKVFEQDKDGRIMECNNLTLINLVLAHQGPMNEKNTTIAVLLVQAVCSIMAFFIRYKLVHFVYEVNH
ncbi:UDP-N-acetylglucosamine--dolichyl-phosphate N-acetylglucosaminephosphotransferase [Sporodiniella umbellata]|nr:UDP-N-acetylglucosamine--dolichyl-phosphate N-acetylglucosaminephosphotransferase [Sporodiniella umbellata]